MLRIPCAMMPHTPRRRKNLGTPASMHWAIQLNLLYDTLKSGAWYVQARGLTIMMKGLRHCYQGIGIATITLRIFRWGPACSDEGTIAPSCSMLLHKDMLQQLLQR